MQIKHIVLMMLIIGLTANAYAGKPASSCDADGDGYLSASKKCGGDDCDDRNPDVNPDAIETCDGIDNNCDGVVDDGCSEPPTKPDRCDQDGDGYNAASKSCKGLDCDDNDATIYPGATEDCDGIDNNCDGVIDEGCGSVCTDADGDGQTDCAGDCDDEDSTVYLGAAELCDGKDNDCDGSIDEGLSTDADGDGYYTEGSCMTPADDCNDADAGVYPGAPELCDGVDNNCDGAVDEGCTNMYPISMAAAGDSITVAYNADGTASLFGGQTYEQYGVSWALGDSLRVYSHAQRLFALNPGFSWDSVFDNYAVSGANIIDLQDQVSQIVANGPYDYVAIFIGHNDICDASTPGEMLPTDMFETLFTTAMDALYAQADPPEVVVSSLARVSDLYDAGKNSSWCNFIWSIGNVCRVVTSGNSAYISAADTRTQEYNGVLESYAEVYGYTYVPQIFETQFTLDDLSDFDCFHPNVNGQNRISEIIWNNGLYGP